MSERTITDFIEIYPVFFEGWLRLRASLAAFLSGGTSVAFLPLLGGFADWYSLIPPALLGSGMLYLHYVGEWPRILYKQRKAPETRPRLVRFGTLIFFVGIWTWIIFGLPFIEAFLAQGTFQTVLLIAKGLIVSAGTVIITFGIFGNWKRLPSMAETSSRKALRMMKDAGFGIHDDPLWVALDPSLQTPAQTYPGGGGSVILVSPSYVDTKWGGGLDNILVHEMSHIHGRETNHPWEDQKIINEIKAHYETAKQYSTKSFQLRTLVKSMFNLQEILTNDIAFKVLERSGVAWIDPTKEMLQNLTSSKPMWALGATRKRWNNACIDRR